MKPTLLKLSALLLLAVIFSCQKPPIIDPEPIEDPEEPEESIYPIDVPFKECSTVTCYPVDLGYDNKVIIINSKEEMEKYILCVAHVGALSNFNFSKKSLLLASGSVNNGIVKVVVNNLQQIDSTIYQLNIERHTFESPNAEKWVKAISVEKLKDESIVELNITEEKWPMGLDLGFYRPVEPNSSYYRLQFYDRENLGITPKNAFLEPLLYQYEIIKDSINLKYLGIYYFRMINNTKFEIELPDFKNPGNIVFIIFEKI
jgi:hypothetical protein